MSRFRTIGIATFALAFCGRVSLARCTASPVPPPDPVQYVCINQTVTAFYNSSLRRYNFFPFDGCTVRAFDLSKQIEDTCGYPMPQYWIWQPQPPLNLTSNLPKKIL